MGFEAATKRDAQVWLSRLHTAVVDNVIEPHAEASPVTLREYAQQRLAR